MVEVDASDKIVWSVNGSELPGMGIRWFAGIQALPNGNIFICNAGGKVPFMEISRNKEIVWHSSPDSTFPLGHGIHRLDIPGQPRK